MFKDLYPFRLYIRHLPNIIMFPISIVLNIIIWFWLFWQIKPQAELIFLHYNILFGVDFIGEWWKLIYIPLTGLIILIINVLLGWLLFNRDKFIAELLNAVSILCQIFLLVVASLLVFLNV